MVNIPDITMCVNEKCSMRKECYRSQEKPSEYQSWSNFENTCNENSGFNELIKVGINE